MDAPHLFKGGHIPEGAETALIGISYCPAWTGCRKSCRKMPSFPHPKRPSHRRLPSKWLRGVPALPIL